MSKFNIGDLVVLKSGSMRMCVEDTSDETEVACLWCHEGVIGRDRFNVALLNKWEHREHDGGHRGGHRGGDRDDRGPRGGGGRSFGGDRDGGGKPYGGGGGGGHRGGGGDRFDDRPRKTGWDGKPRQKNHYRSDD